MEKSKKKILVPKGTSSYQAHWIVDKETENETGLDQVDEEDEMMLTDPVDWTGVKQPVVTLEESEPSEAIEYEEVDVDEAHDAFEEIDQDENDLQ